PTGNGDSGCKRADGRWSGPVISPRDDDATARRGVVAPVELPGRNNPGEDRRYDNGGTEESDRMRKSKSRRVGRHAAAMLLLRPRDGHVHDLAELHRRPIERGWLVPPVLRRTEDLPVISCHNGSAHHRLDDVAVLVDDDFNGADHRLLHLAGVRRELLPQND